MPLSSSCPVSVADIEGDTDPGRDHLTFSSDILIQFTDQEAVDQIITEHREDREALALGGKFLTKAEPSASATLPMPSSMTTASIIARNFFMGNQSPFNVFICTQFPARDTIPAWGIGSGYPHTFDKIISHIQIKSTHFYNSNQ